MKLKDVFEKSVQFLKEKNFETPRLDVEIMISEILKIDRIQIYVRYEQPLKEDEIQKCRDALKRRAAGEPVAYIVGKKGFYKQDFFCGPGVLVPRPETELIVETVLDYLEKNKLTTPRILDLGAGTGCIGFSIVNSAPASELVSIERSKLAFAYLEKNYHEQKNKERIRILNDDVQLCLNENLGYFDVIVANPPYIDRNDSQVQKSVVQFEPHEALFSDDLGLADIKKWLLLAAKRVQQKGLIVFEIGCQQKASLLSFTQKEMSDWDCQIVKDLSGLDRTLICIR